MSEWLAAWAYEKNELIEWMTEGLREWTNERANERRFKPTNEGLNERMMEWGNVKEWLCEWGSECVRACVSECVCAWVCECDAMHGWVNEWVNGWLHVWLPVWLNELLLHWATHSLSYCTPSLSHLFAPIFWCSLLKHPIDNQILHLPNFLPICACSRGGHFIPSISWGRLPPT